MIRTIKPCEKRNAFQKASIRWYNHYFTKKCLRINRMPEHLYNEEQLYKEEHLCNETQLSDYDNRSLLQELRYAVRASPFASVNTGYFKSYLHANIFLD